MRKGQVFVIAILTAILGFGGGYFFYANTVARNASAQSICSQFLVGVHQSP